MGEFKINEEGLNKVVERFWNKRDAREICGSVEVLRKVLLEYAKNTTDQCVNCIYSSPTRGRISWSKRYCALKLKPNGNCPMHTPIVAKE